MKATDRYLLFSFAALVVFILVAGFTFYYWLHADLRSQRAYLAALPGVTETKVYGDFQEIYYVRLHIEKDSASHVIGIVPFGNLADEGAQYVVCRIDQYDFDVTGLTGIDIGSNGWFAEVWGAEYNSLHELVSQCDQLSRRAKDLRAEYGDRRIHVTGADGREYAVRIELKESDM